MVQNHGDVSAIKSPQLTNDPRLWDISGVEIGKVVVPVCCNSATELEVRDLEDRKNGVRARDLSAAPPLLALVEGASDDVLDTNPDPCLQL